MNERAQESKRAREREICIPLGVQRSISLSGLIGHETPIHKRTSYLPQHTQWPASPRFLFPCNIHMRVNISILNRSISSWFPPMINYVRMLVSQVIRQFSSFRRASHADGDSRCSTHSSIVTGTLITWHVSVKLLLMLRLAQLLVCLPVY